jgi:hypothetical protein
MTTSIKIDNISATNVWFDKEKLVVQLSDGREIATPLSWFPTLMKASESQKSNWRFIGKGRGIHWEDLDEDISIACLLKS